MHRTDQSVGSTADRIRAVAWTPTVVSVAWGVCLREAAVEVMGRSCHAQPQAVNRLP